MADETSKGFFRRRSSRTGSDISEDTELLKEIRDALSAHSSGIISEEKSSTRQLRNELKGISNDLKQIVAALSGGGGGRRMPPSGGGLGGGGSKGSGGGSGKDNDPIKNLLEDIKDGIIALTRRSGGGEEGAGGQGGPGGGFAEFREIQKTFDLFNKELEAVTDYIAIAYGGAVAELAKNYDMLKDKALEFGRTLTSLNTVTDYVMTRYQNSMDAASAGIVNFSHLLTDEFTTILNKRDGLQATFELVKQSLQDGLVSPLISVNHSLDGLARDLRTNRFAIHDSGFNYSRRMDFETMNSVMMDMYDLQLRSGIREEFLSSYTRQNVMKQLSYLDLIAQNTGLTLEEIMKQTKQDREKFAELNAAAILSNDQRETFQRVHTTLTQLGQSGLADMIKGVAEAGGSFELYLSRNEDMVGGMVQIMPELRRLLTIANDKSLTDEELSEQMITLIKNLDPNLSGMVASEVVKEAVIKIFSERGKLFNRDGLGRDITMDEQGETSWIRSIGEFLKNTFPIASIVGVSTAIVANTLFLGKNTLALWANTKALLGKSWKEPFDYARRGLGGKQAPRAGLGKRIGTMLGGRGAAQGLGKTTPGTAVRGLRMFGSALGRMAPMALGLLNPWTLGILGGGAAAYGGYKLLQNFFPETMGSITGGLGSMLGIGSANAATMSSIPKSAMADGNLDIVGKKTTTEIMLRRQSDTLNELVTLFKENNDINNRIRHNTDRIGVTERGFFDRLINWGSDDKVYPGEPTKK